MDQMKCCTKCGQTKRLAEFHAHRRMRDGRNPRCKVCTREDVRISNAKNPQKNRDRVMAWKVANREREKARNSAYRRNNVNKVRDWLLRRNYGISVEDYQQMYDAQGGCCAICRTAQAELTRRLAVDHNHTTGAVRGLLCIPCNQALGCLRDSDELLQSARSYLARYAPSQSSVVGEA